MLTTRPLFLRPAFLLIVIVAWAIPLFAQTADGLMNVRGRIVDQNGALVVNAKITLAAEKQPVVTTSTNDNGEFSASVTENDYLMTVSAPGFEKFSQNLSVHRTDAAPVEIALAMGGVDAFVTVSGGGEYGVTATSSATKTMTALRDIPQSIAVVPRQQIADQSMTSVGDVVRYIPGVSAHQGENNRDQVIIRGQNSSADFYVNGVRDDTQYYRDLYNLDRLESLKGPNALVFGRGGGGGVINRVTKEAGPDPITEFAFQGGMYGNKRVTGDFDRALTNKLAFRLNGVYENSNSFRRFVGLDRAAINPTFTSTPGTTTTITFGYEFLHDRRVADRGITSFAGRPANVDASTYYGNPDDSRVRADVHLFTGKISKQIGRLNITNHSQFGDYDRGYQNYVPGAANAAGTLVTLTAYNNATKRKNLFNQTDLVYSVSTGGVKHVLLGGTELGRQLTDNFRNTGYFNNTSTSIQVAFDNPVTTVPVTFRQSLTDADNHIRLNLGAAYVQDQIELSRYVQVFVGARYDYFDLRYHNNRNGDDIRRIDHPLSPRAGLVIKPVQAVSLYGSYSVSYLPSSGDQFSSLTAITQQLKPEKFENIETGVKWDIRPSLLLTAALYRLDRTNTRSTDPNDPTHIIQTGSQRTNGFEIGLNGRLTRNWNITGGYAYQNAFITSATAAAAAGKQVAQVPHHSFAIWNKYQLTTRLSAGLGIINRSDSFTGVDNTVVLPGYTRADAGIFYTINEKWRIQANIENLTNTRYYLNADSNTNISPGSPTAVRVGLVARF
jgi:catecholate siderophore receptor